MVPANANLAACLALHARETTRRASLEDCSRPIRATSGRIRLCEGRSQIADARFVARPPTASLTAGGPCGTTTSVQPLTEPRASPTLTFSNPSKGGGTRTQSLIGLFAVVVGLAIGAAGGAYAATANSSWQTYAQVGVVCGQQKAAINTPPNGLYASGFSRTLNSNCGSFTDQPSGCIGAMAWMLNGAGKLCKLTNWNYNTYSTFSWGVDTSSGTGDCANPSSIQSIGFGRFYNV